ARPDRTSEYICPHLLRWLSRHPWRVPLMLSGGLAGGSGGDMVSSILSIGGCCCLATGVVLAARYVARRVDWERVGSDPYAAIGLSLLSRYPELANVLSVAQREAAEPERPNDTAAA